MGANGTGQVVAVVLWRGCVATKLEVEARTDAAWADEIRCHLTAALQAPPVPYAGVAHHRWKWTCHEGGSHAVLVASRCFLRFGTLHTGNMGEPSNDLQRLEQTCPVSNIGRRLSLASLNIVGHSKAGLRLWRPRPLACHRSLNTRRQTGTSQEMYSAKGS
jgi:hypothetical protein